MSCTKDPKSYYGIFSIFFKTKLFVLFLIYIILVLLVSLSFSFFYEIYYTGNTSFIKEITWLEKWYFSIITFMSPGFTEFLPKDSFSRILSTINGLVGLSFNALFLSILVAKALQPHEPFEIVPFLLYDPKTKKFTIRFYSTLPANCYNLTFRLFRFSIYQNDNNKQVGSTKEIKVTPHYRNTLLKNYGILVKAKVDFKENGQNSSMKQNYIRKKIPIEWIDPENPKCLEGHFYLTIEAETIQGKMFQTINFYLNKDNIKIGRHKLLNEDNHLTLDTWYNWKSYRWDLWGEFEQIPDIEKYNNDLIIKRYQ